jgi:hypothetical protein
VKPLQDEPDAWIAELFSDEWGTYWCIADKRSADDAIALAAKYDGPFDGEVSAKVVTGRVEMRDGEPWLTEDPDAELEFWRVDAG